MSSMTGSDPTITFPRLVSERAAAVPQVAAAPVSNPGIEFDAGWVNRVRVNLSAAERRVETLPKRRTVKKAWQAAWLLKAVTLMDLTTLSADDTAGRVSRLCAKARTPVRADLLEALGWGARPLTTAAVCVYHEMVPVARAALAGTGIAIAAVSTGFPAGLSPLELRLEEIRRSVQAGATEIDVVISRRHVLTSDWRALYAEVRAFRQACGPAHMKTILGTGAAGLHRQSGEGRGGRDDGRLGLHQDLHGNGARERHAAREPGDDAHDSRICRADRIPVRDSSRRAASPAQNRP